jgi:hypothetical protein
MSESVNRPLEDDEEVDTGMDEETQMARVMMLSRQEFERERRRDRQRDRERGHEEDRSTTNLVSRLLRMI